MRMYNKLLYSLLFAHCYICVAHGATSTPFSQYGVIQNVQNYSSNPFWNPNGPYNQRMPTAVYVDGPEINAGDCQRTVSALVANICATMNNCVGVQLSDVRPSLMLQLSQLPGHAYATSCAGYIDSEFDNYVKKYAHAGVSTGTVAFPDATAPSNTNTVFEIQNPFSVPTAQWERDVAERTAELEQLHAETGGNTGALAKNAFPATTSDISLTERMNNLTDGYAPYTGKSAYNTLDIQDYEEYKKEYDELMGYGTGTYNVAYKCDEHGGTPPTGNATATYNDTYHVASSIGCCPSSQNLRLKYWQVQRDGTTDKAQFDTHQPGASFKWQYNEDKVFIAVCEKVQAPAQSGTFWQRALDAARKRNETETLEEDDDGVDDTGATAVTETIAGTPVYTGEYDE